MTWASRPYKALMRDYLLHASAPYRQTIFLPGWDEEAKTGCLCVERALELERIDHTTKVIAAECRQDLAARIKDRLDSFQFDTPPLLHVGELYDLRLASDDRIDFAMLDFLGTLDGKLAAWITTELASHLAPRATIGVTLTHTWRNNAFMDACAYAWKTQPRWRMLAIDYAGRMGITDSYILVHLVVLKSVLANFDYTYRRVQLYRDSRRIMLAYRMDDLTPVKSRKWPTTQEVLDSVCNTVII